MATKRVEVKMNKTIHDVSTNLIEVVELTVEELELEKQKTIQHTQKIADDKTAQAQAAADKAALLAKLGITADEAKLLLN